MKHCSLLFLPLALSGGDLLAQRDLAAGFGAQSLLIDLEAVTGEVGNLGVQYLNGEIFTSTRRAVGSLEEHFVNVFDAEGTRVRSWVQPGFAQASTWGFRDGASDGNCLMFGYEFGIQLMDSGGQSVTQLRTQAGVVQVVGGLIAGNALNLENAGVVRALAYDRSGNGGGGSFWTGNFGSSVFEIDVDGDVLLSYPNAGESSYGFGIEPAGDRTVMWINAAPNGGAMAEYDLRAGSLTGRVMGEFLDGSLQGGLDVIPASFGRGPVASGFDLAYVRQRPDFLRVRRLHLDVAGTGIPPSPRTRSGLVEPDLLASVDDEKFFQRSSKGTWLYDNASFALNLYLDISRDPGNGQGVGGLNGTPAAIFANIGPEAAPGLNAESNLLGIRELVHLQPELTIPGAVLPVPSRPLILSNGPSASHLSAWRISMVPGVQFVAIGECLRFQGLWIDADVAFLPVAMTNQIRFCRGPDKPVLSGAYVECFGGNSFNADTSRGFFSVTNEEVDPQRSIVRLQFTALPNNPSPTTLTLQAEFFRWDTDQENIADTFLGGNSLSLGCLGTYRNGSDVTTGLIYAGTPASICDPSGLQGWRGEDDGPTVYGSFREDWLTLVFDFSPDTFMGGAVFEFDADTDGGVGLDGGSMAGIVVVAEFRDGSISTTELIADLINPTRSFAQF